MIESAATFAFACFALAMLMNLWKVVTAPDVADRILALDTLTINAIALIVLMQIQQGSAVYFEAALLLAMVGFVGTVAYCKFLLRGDIVE